MTYRGSTPIGKSNKGAKWHCGCHTPISNKILLSILKTQVNHDI